MSDRLEYDVLLIGGSPSNLALAHHLVSLAKESGQTLSMAIIEKAAEFGAHIVSGAVTKPHVIKKLFPNWQDLNIPTEGECTASHFKVLGERYDWDVPRFVQPEGIKKEGYWILTLSLFVAWMVNYLKERLSDAPNVTVDFYPGFSAHQIIYDGSRVVGVQVVEEATGNPAEDNIYGRVTCFGDKGFISQDLVKKFNLRDNPQVWSVGVKEVWQLPPDKSYEGQVFHTMGSPLVDGTMGGGFVYGMKNNRLTIGLVMSLDSPNPNINPQQRLQDYKKHPWLQEMISGGKLLKYGAALLPEGGYYSLPKKFAVDGALLMGDALGVLDVGNLAGIDKAMECGYQAAEVIHQELARNGKFAQTVLDEYQSRVMDSFVGKDLKTGRYFRHAWSENNRLLRRYLPSVIDGIDGPGAGLGFLKVGLTNNPVTALQDALRLKSLLDGQVDAGPVKYAKDHTHIVPDYKPARAFPNGKGTFDKTTLYSRPDAVFFAETRYHEGNQHIDEFDSATCMACIAKYDALSKDTPCVSDCTAEVHRVDVLGGIRKHGMSLENCVQCRTCEIVCPQENLRVKPTAQGAGPNFLGL
ncbi:MAG: electron-transfer flavoprotein:ubiquinone oxidoreductase [Vampirovibrionales bacterium]|nr:electron-transfer flavoprotein:ubiquinone oxidoreductase [Vampirovibrionales bacterium]